MTTMSTTMVVLYLACGLVCTHAGTRRNRPSRSTSAVPHRMTYALVAGLLCLASYWSDWPNSAQSSSYPGNWLAVAAQTRSSRRNPPPPAIAMCHHATMRRWLFVLTALLPILALAARRPTRRPPKPPWPRPSAASATPCASATATSSPTSRWSLRDSVRHPGRLGLSPASAARTGLARQHRRAGGRVPTPTAIAVSFQFRGVTPTGDARLSPPHRRPADLPKALAGAAQGRPLPARCSGTATATWCHTWSSSTRRADSIWRSGICDGRRGDSADVTELAAVATATFRWPALRRSPPRTSPRSSDNPVGRQLQPLPGRRRPCGVRRARRHANSRLRHADSRRADRSRRRARAAEALGGRALKIYVLPDAHGGAVAAALMNAALDDARDHGAGTGGLGVNQKNERAQRFTANTASWSAGPSRSGSGTRLKTTTR